MKTMKKVFALLLALTMIMSLAISVAADTTHTVTISNEKSGYTYKAYPIFSGDLSGVKLTNIVWASGFNGTDFLADLKADTALGAKFTDCATAEDVANVAATLNATETIAFAALAAASKGTAVATSTYTAPVEANVEEGIVAAAGYYTIAGLADGYYLIIDETADVPDGDAGSRILLNVVGDDITVAPKKDIPDIDKVIVGADSANGGEGKGTAVNVGDVVNFKVTSKVPDMTGYTTYTFKVTDTMSNGLTFNGVDTVKVSVGGVDKTKDTDYTVTVTGQTIVINFNNFIQYTKDAAIVITYSATLNNYALTTDKEVNDVKLTYSNNPNTDSEGDTEHKKTYVYDFDIDVDKFVKGSETTKLAGAKFVLRNADSDSAKYYKKGTAGKVTWVDTKGEATELTTGDDGKVSFTGLDAGTYYLEETEAPTGYNKLTARKSVEITATYNADGTLASSSTTLQEDGQYSLEADVENSSGSELPETGGIGTTIFYVVGGMMMLGAVVVLVTMKKMSGKVER